MVRISQEAMYILMETCILHRPSLHKMTLDGEEGYNILVSSATETQKGMYRKKVDLVL